MNNISDDLKQQLIAEAQRIQQNSYSPYSNFPVGSAVLTRSGRMVSGVNVENASYGLTRCAEQNAIGTMVGQGDTEIAAVAVSSRNGVTPCGACRQVLLEFATQDVPVWLIATDTGTISQTSLHKLIPDSFNKDLLEAGQNNEPNE